MSYGKMRTPVQLLSTEAVKDTEGFAAQQDKVLAEVRAYHEARHGSERWANRAAFSEATDLFRFRAIPGVVVSTKLFLLCEGCRYDITSVEDVKGRGMYVEILAKKVVAANGYRKKPRSYGWPPTSIWKVTGGVSWKMPLPP